MVGASALLVYAEGRWRGVPQGCMFAVSRRGRLETPPATAVRQALRLLAARLPSRARAGDPLPYRRSSKHGHRASNACCKESRHDALPSVDAWGAKRKRDSTSSEVQLPSTITTVATVHTPSNPAQRSPVNSTTIKRKRQSSKSNSEDSQDTVKSAKNHSTHKHKPPWKKRRSISKETSPILKCNTLSKNHNQSNIAEYLHPKPTCVKQTEQRIRNRPQRNVTLNISSDDSAFETSTTRKPHSKRRTPTSAATPAHTRSNRVEMRSQPDVCRELVIEERDVQILRAFLQRHYPDRELIKFDTDDNYKKMHFYRINPLVNVERCPRIARLLRAGPHRAQLTLLDFASKLGLRSVSGASSDKPRRKEGKSRALSSDSNAENKENYNKPASASNHIKSDAVLKEPVKAQTDAVLKESVTAQISNHNMRAKPRRKAKVVTSKSKGSSRVYSNLEDHAIVSWVSNGGRASLVNGNRLWAQLQQQYRALTGRERTWHSLRNRYLRYILPALGALALPQALQARLRAAAVTGELKARKKRSLPRAAFPMPPRGAATRLAAPRSLYDDDDGDADPAPRPPAGRGSSSEPTRRVSTGRQQDNQKSRTGDSSSESTKPPNRRLSPSDPNRRVSTGRQQDIQKSTTRDSSTESTKPPNRRKPGMSNALAETKRRKPTTRDSLKKSAMQFSRRNNISPSSSDTIESTKQSPRRKSRRRNIISTSSESTNRSPRRKSRRFFMSTSSDGSGVSTTQSPRRKSSRRNLPTEPKRRSLRYNSKSSSRSSPRETTQQDKASSSTKRSRRKANRRNSPSESVPLSSRSSAKQNTVAKEKAHVDPNPKARRMRRLFNPNAVF